MRESTFDFLFQSQDAVNEFFEPLKKKMGLGFFFFGRFYDSGKTCMATTNSDIYTYFSEKKICLASPVEEEFIDTQFHYFIDMNGYYSEALAAFKVWYPFDLFKRYPGYYELFCFAYEGYQSPLVLNRYLQNLDLLNEFTKQAQEQVNEIFSASKNFHFNLPDEMRNNLLGLPSLQKSDGRCYLDDSLYLTKKERACLYHLGRGATAKVAANNLDLSFRTVEKHIANIKDRFGCASKYHLLQMLREKYFYDFDVE